MGHSVFLVANKPTVVRAYLSRTSGGAITVRGVLAVRRTPTGPIESIPSLDTAEIKSAQNGQLRAKRLVYRTRTRPYLWSPAYRSLRRNPR